MTAIFSIHFDRPMPTVPFVDPTFVINPAAPAVSPALNCGLTFHFCCCWKSRQLVRHFLGQMCHGASGGSGIDMLCDIIGMLRGPSCFAERLCFPNHSPKALAGCAHSQPDRPVNHRIRCERSRIV